MANWSVGFFVVLLLACQQVSSKEGSSTTTSFCSDQPSCETCVAQQIRNKNYGNLNPAANCVWEVTSSGQLCVETYTPSQEISNVAFNRPGCYTIPSTTTTQPPPVPTCNEQTTCQSCVSTALNLGTRSRNQATCVWEVTSYSQGCVEEYTPSQEITNVAFNQYGCEQIPTTTTTAPTTPPYRNQCQNEKTCESCVVTRGDTSQPEFDAYGNPNPAANCVWEVTSSGELCVETYTPSQEISNVAFNGNGCKAIPTTTTTPAPTTPPYRNQCQNEKTCESCVVTTFVSFQPDLYKNSASNCVWEVTSSGNECVEKYTPSQEITNVAFNREGCRTIPSVSTAAPPKSDPCLQENVCESCVQTIAASENDSTCLWIVANSEGQCAKTFNLSEEIEKVVYSTNGCQTESNSSSTTTPTPVIPDSGSRCECTENDAIRANSDDQLNEIDDDIVVAEIISVNDEQEKDEFDFFGANVADRLRKVQYSSPKLASSIRYEIQKALFDNEKLLLKAPRRLTGGSTIPSTTTPAPSNMKNQCLNKKTCESCTVTKNNDSFFICVWEGSKYGQQCVEFDNISNGTVFVVTGPNLCPIPSTKTPPPSSPQSVSICTKQKMCQSCVSTLIQTEVVFGNKISTTPSTIVDPCRGENTCESCVQTLVTSELERLSINRPYCLWIATRLEGRCARTLALPHDIENIAFTTSQTGWNSSTSVPSSPKLGFGDSESKCKCAENDSIQANAGDQVNEIEDDDDIIVAKIRAQNKGQQKDDDYFGENIIQRIRMVQAGSPKLASSILGGGIHGSSSPDPCLRGTTCESCVGIKTKANNCVWEVTSSGQLCVQKYVPSQEISDVAFTRDGPSIPTTTTPTPAKSYRGMVNPISHVSTTEKSIVQQLYCNEQTTCESCLSLRVQPRCVWNRDDGTCSTRTYFSTNMGGYNIKPEDCERIWNATTTTPIPTSPEPTHFETPTESNASTTTIYISEIFSMSHMDEKDELDYFGEHIVGRIRKIQESSPRLASAIRYEIQKVLFDKEEMLKQNARRFMLWRSLK
ncbi:hypothetical protein Ocin01_07429 [Orchesella cincta]|uniref:PSI domain-containing protein n=1 Tax=Orchesella cincta TaxID=48709 RepID=A0A1D2N206_ORCCI|nr:hypothetical protein Ocin01_07429 [Orchesella cincta]